MKKILIITAFTGCLFANDFNVLKFEDLNKLNDSIKIGQSVKVNSETFYKCTNTVFSDSSCEQYGKKIRSLAMRNNYPPICIGDESTVDLNIETKKIKEAIIKKLESFEINIQNLSAEKQIEHTSKLKYEIDGIIFNKETYMKKVFFCKNKKNKKNIYLLWEKILADTTANRYLKVQ